MKLEQLKVQLYADGADKKGMLELYKNPLLKGFTTNPSLMKKAGVTDYEAYAKELLQIIKDKPVSFEVFSDEFPEMRRQALKIKNWQENVYVKIPITNTKGESSVPLIRELAQEGVKLNITALFLTSQVKDTVAALNPKVPSIISVFAGRIADTGLDPEPIMKECAAITKTNPKAELLWASVREVLNIFQADACGCQIVTVPHDILAKAVKMCGMDLAQVSLDTVRIFDQDSRAAGFKL